MFDALVIRRNASAGHGAVDLGRLAEAMLFYRTVRMCISRGGLRQLIAKCGPETVVELVENANLQTVYLDVDTGIYTLDTGTSRERHKPITFKILDGTYSDRAYEDTAISLFQEATGKSGKGRRLANRFMARAHLHRTPNDLLDAARADWQNEPFIQQAICESLTELAPAYTRIEDVRVVLRPQEDESYRFESNLDWARLDKAYEPREDISKLTTGYLLGNILDVREDLYLAAVFGSGIAQNSLAARLTRIMCADLTAVVDKQQATIERFQQLVVRGVNDLAGSINSGSHSFDDFLKLLRRADEFRSWLDRHPPDEDLVRSYFAEASKESWLASQPVKTLRWMLPVAAGFALFLPDGVISAPIAAGVLTAVDKLMLERFAQGWRPSSFIDNDLRPMLSS
jgi:hypothetical protein